MDWDDYLRTKRPIIGNLPKQPKAPLIKQEYLELTAVCEEMANHIEDHLTGG